MITAKNIAELRARTNLPVMECKTALVEAKGDQKVALQILKKKGLARVAKKSERETKSGLIESYVHDGKIGVLVEVLSETDFVAKNDHFKKFVHDLTLHITASNPVYISKDEVTKDEIEKKKKEYTNQAKSEGKPEKIAQKIAQGKLKKYYQEICLLNQPFIKDQSINISNLLSDLVTKVGENIQISRFKRIELGKE